MVHNHLKLYFCVASCKIFQPLWLQDPATQINPLSKVATLAPKLAKPLGLAPPPLFLHPVSLIRIEHHFVLFILMFCVNKVTQKLDYGVSTSLSSQLEKLTNFPKDNIMTIFWVVSLSLQQQDKCRHYYNTFKDFTYNNFTYNIIKYDMSYMFFIQCYQLNYL